MDEVNYEALVESLTDALTEIEHHLPYDVNAQNLLWLYQIKAIEAQTRELAHIGDALNMISEHLAHLTGNVSVIARSSEEIAGTDDTVGWLQRISEKLEGV